MKDKHILLVEDNPEDVFMTERALKKANILNRIVVARDGQEAIEYLFCTGKYAGRDINDKPQIVLLDLNMPKIGGLDVLRRIRADERTSLLPVVMLTTSGEDKDRIGSYNLGCNSYVRKPVDFEQFSQAVRELGLYWLLMNESP